jgi:hypothetical protein
LRVKNNTVAPRLQVEEIRATIHAVSVLADDPEPIYHEVTRLLDGADIDPDDYPVEPVLLSTHFDALWRLMKRAASMSIHRPYPCPNCSHPVACLCLIHTDVHVIVNALGNAELPDFWSANLFDIHHCEVIQ